MANRLDTTVMITQATSDTVISRNPLLVDVGHVLPTVKFIGKMSTNVTLVFLALYFLFLWIAWVLAVWVTKPKSAEPSAP